MIERYRQLDPKTRKRLGYVAFLAVWVVLGGGPMVESLLSEAVTVTAGSGSLDPYRYHYFQPDLGNVIIVDGEERRSFFYRHLKYGDSKHKIIIYRPGNAMDPALLDHGKYETVPEVRGEEEVDERRRDHPEAVVEDQVLISGGSGVLEQVDYVFHIPEGRSLIMEGPTLTVYPDGSREFDVWTIMVVQDGALGGMSREAFGQGGTYEVVDARDQQREIDERLRAHPNAHVAIEK